jgi:hypothetical protein
VKQEIDMQQITLAPGYVFAPIARDDIELNHFLLEYVEAGAEEWSGENEVLVIQTDNEFEFLPNKIGQILPIFSAEDCACAVVVIDDLKAGIC